MEEFRLALQGSPSGTLCDGHEIGYAHTVGTGPVLVWGRGVSLIGSGTTDG